MGQCQAARKNAETDFRLRHSGGKAKTVIIGKTQSTPEERITVLQQDQEVGERGSPVATLVDAAKHRRPIVLLVGRQYEQLPWSLGTAAYAVLGW